MEHAKESLSLQTQFWNRWNSTHRENQLHDISLRQAEIVTGWLDRLGRRDLAILEVGCGTGWFCDRLSRYGKVTATDLSDEVLSRARQRVPAASFVAGDFMALNFEKAAYDVVVALEVLSHIADQKAFVRKVSSLLKPGGHLMLATQNRYVLEQFNAVAPPEPGQLRHWVDKRELGILLARQLSTLELFSVSPRSNKGLLRVMNSARVNRPIRALFGNRIELLKERLGLGWTLMALARKQ